LAGVCCHAALAATAAAAADADVDAVVEEVVDDTDVAESDMDDVRESSAPWPASSLRLRTG